VLIDPALPGGYMGITHQVSNYPGFEQPQPGYMLAHYMSEQAKNAGIDFKVAVDITSVDLQKKEIVIDELETIRAKKIIIATGTSPNPMNIPGEKELKGKGISYCATCDAKYYVDKDVVVIGGGNSAVEESLFITKFAKTLTIVHRSDKLKANEIAIENVLSHPKINILFGQQPHSFKRQGEKMITTIENRKTKELSTLVSDGVFVFIGLRSNVELFHDSQLKSDAWGYLVTDEDMKTNIPDVFAIGDITSKKYRQITTAVADGTIAAIAVSKEL
jgi:thioredoxin reductase (NADPH)